VKGRSASSSLPSARRESRTAFSGYMFVWRSALTVIGAYGVRYGSSAFRLATGTVQGNSEDGCTVARTSRTMRHQLRGFYHLASFMMTAASFAAFQDGCRLMLRSFHV
jgi:hypothetical protein